MPEKLRWHKPQQYHHPASASASALQSLPKRLLKKTAEAGIFE
jgi:hypothetical protein